MRRDKRRVGNIGYLPWICYVLAVALWWFVSAVEVGLFAQLPPAAKLTFAQVRPLVIGLVIVGAVVHLVLIGYRVWIDLHGRWQMVAQFSADGIRVGEGELLDWNLVEISWGGPYRRERFVMRTPYRKVDVPAAQVDCEREDLVAAVTSMAPAGVAVRSLRAP